MKILVAGANGRVGQKLVENLAEKGHTVYAGARNPERIEKRTNVFPTLLDVHEEVSKLAKQVGDVDIIYSTIGSRGKDLLQTDLYGTTKLMTVGKEKNIQRFISLSSVFSLEPSKWDGSITNYTIARYFSDLFLMHESGLSYTILQPGLLTETKGSGKVTFSVEKTQPNSIDNVASVLAKLLNYPNTVNKVILMSDGDKEIRKALEGV